MASTTVLLAVCFVFSGIIFAAADVNCSGAVTGFATGMQTCTSSGPNYGKMCMKTEINGMLVQGCDGSPNVPSMCSLAGNPRTCCKIAASGQKIICKASDFSTLVSAAAFQNCSAECQLAPGCFDDTAMFGQMPEPKCLFLLGQTSFGCDWTLSQIQKDCPACPYDYTGKNMSTELGDLCRTSCGRCQSETTTMTGTTMGNVPPSTGTTTSNSPPSNVTGTTTSNSAMSTETTTTTTATYNTTTKISGSSAKGFMNGCIPSIPSLIGIVLSAIAVMRG